MAGFSGSSNSMEVTTAREARDAGVQFQIKLEAIQAAMEAAYNDLLDKHETLQENFDQAMACGQDDALYVGEGAPGADADGCKEVPSVPVGTVAMFKTGSCPTGWVRDSWWDGRFPRGASGSIGSAGGASSVKLRDDHLPKHTHEYSRAKQHRTKIENDTEFAVVVRLSYDTRNTDSCDGCKNRSFSVLNPYRNTLFCRKT